MNLGEMREWVLRTIGRPERLQQALDSINSAIEYVTAKGDFASDLIENSCNLSSSVYIHAIDITTTMPRFRKIKYLRPDGYSVYLKWKDSSRVFVEKAPGVGTELIDVWYRAGNQLLIKLSVLQSILHFGYYIFPERLVDTADEYWMLDQMPTVIHAFAVALEYESIGNESEASRYDKKAERFLFVHKSDKQDAVSHS